MKIKTSELTGPALDWAVATCQGYKNLQKLPNRMGHEPCLAMIPPREAYGPVELWELGYSTDWAHGGPIIEREGIAIDCIRCDGKIDGWIAALPMFDEAKYEKPAPTPLVAAMRCYVASRLGDEVEVPEGL